MNVELLERIEAIGSRLEKESLIGTMDEATRGFVVLALDPEVTFGVTVNENDWVAYTVARAGPGFLSDFWDELEIVLEKLRDRELTGGAAQSAIERILKGSPGMLETKWACRVINRNLRAGFDIKTVNKVFGETVVEKFAVQLATPYDPDMVLAGDWIFEPKLDGNRMVVDTDVAYSRNGKVYEAAPHIVRELEGISGLLVPDGETMGNLGFDQSSGALRRKDKKNRDAEFTYWVFDLFTQDEWDRKVTGPLRQRKARILELFKQNSFKHIQMVPWTIVHEPTFQTVDQITRQFVEQGFEGAMAKRLDAPAVFDRSNNMLKCKLFYEDDFRVVGFYEGKGKHQGRLGGIVVEGNITWGLLGKPQLPRKVHSKCGSGFDDPTRVQVWGDREGWRNAVVQVKFQEVTAKGSLKFPIFIMRRRDKE